MTADAIVRSRTRGRDRTRADLQDTPEDGYRYDVDGSPYAPPSPSRPHQIPARRFEGAGRPPVIVREGGAGRLSVVVREVAVAPSMIVGEGGAGRLSVVVGEVAGTAYRAASAAGLAAVVDAPIRVESRRAEPAGPRRRV